MKERFEMFTLHFLNGCYCIFGLTQNCLLIIATHRKSSITLNFENFDYYNDGVLTISILFNIAPRVGSFKNCIMLKHIVALDNDPTLHIITSKEEVLSSASPSKLRLSFPFLIFSLYKAWC